MGHTIRPKRHKSRKPTQRLPVRAERRDDAQRLPEKGVLVSVLLPHSNADLRDPLGELAALAEAAGVQVVGTLIQKRTTLSPGYALGKGKIEELGEKLAATEADVVIFDNDLAPRQIRGLEEELGRKVIDRSELILDIFASRAKTREAQLQVELAQLQYAAPRLRGLWTHLERIAGAGGGTAAGAVGGVGTRGPGERQIEIDRRVVRERISHLRREIDEIDRRKQREVRSRTDQFTVSLVGYTNSGKTTLLNRLTGAEQFAADMLFATLETKTARWNLGEGRTVLLSDTVGFVRDLPHHLVASFRATLEETIHADLILHVVDISSPTAWQQMEAVEGVLKSLDCDLIPRVTVLNKVDIADDTSLAEMMARHRTTVAKISALTGEGLGELTGIVRGHVEGDSVETKVKVPHVAGRLMTELDRWAIVKEREYFPDHAELLIRIDRSQLDQLLSRFPEMQLAPPTGEPSASPQ